MNQFQLLSQKRRIFTGPDTFRHRGSYRDLEGDGGLQDPARIRPDFLLDSKTPIRHRDVRQREGDEAVRRGCDVLPLIRLVPALSRRGHLLARVHAAQVVVLVDYSELGKFTWF